jgi:hypothetical protein
MTEHETDREQGVDFAEIDPILEEISYPITANELVARHGEERIERTNAEPISIRELFSSMGEETFESGEEVRQGVLNVMPRDSVGREGYSDRGGSTPDAHDETASMNEDESF